MPHIRPIAELTEEKLLWLEEKANVMRQDLLATLTKAGSGHSAGPLGLADIFSALYFHILTHDAKRPTWAQRDRLFLSNGHCVPIRYVALAHAGYIPMEELSTLRQFGSRLQGHPERPYLPALENTSGPLGDGSPQSAGMAYIGKREDADWHVYCVMSDGELEAGITWEAALFAGKHRLHNLTWIIDRNNIQIDGFTEDVMPLEPLRDKFAAFNFEVIDIDGNNIREFVDACRYAKTVFERPTVIIAHTIPGKGVSFMEYQPAWHGKPPKDKQELNKALKELRTLEGQIRSEHE